MRRRLTWLVMLGACTRAPAGPGAPASPPVPGDMSRAPGPERQPIPAAPAEPVDLPAVADPPATPADPARPPKPLAPVTLAADAGLRLVLERRGWDFAAAPGLVVVLGADFTEVEAFAADTGASVWRTKAQQAPNGRHTLHVRGEQLILHAGPTRIHALLRDGRVLGSFPAFFNGSDSQCALRVQEGAALAEWNEWLPPAAAGSACAEVCECDLRLFDCVLGTPLGTPFRASETHLYHDLGEPHDTVCFNRPALLLRAAAATIVRVEDAAHDPTIMGLDPRTGATLWQRRDLGAAISQYGDEAGTDPAGTLCWLADRSSAVVFDCAAGTTRWRATTGEPETHGQTALRWHQGALAVTHQDARRTKIELRDARVGKRRWQRSLPADHWPLLPGEAPPRYPRTEVRSYVVLEPTTGATRAEIQLAAGQALYSAPGGGYLRHGDGKLAEFDARGAPLRERALVGDALARVTRTHLVLRGADELRVLRRDTLQPALVLAGSWSVSPSEAALGAEVLLLTEHRGPDMGRVLLLRPKP